VLFYRVYKDSFLEGMARGEFNYLRYFLHRQKVTKKLLMPKGDFAQEAGANHG